jgi:ribosome maturation factor RimP
LAVIRSRLRAVIEPAVIEAGLDLEDLGVVRAGRRLLVRITVDGDAALSHDQLSDLSRDLSARLDSAEETGDALTPDSYTLEVSSPGVDRPLTLTRHWRRNVGRLVKVKAGERTITARVVSVDEAGVTFDPADAGPSKATSAKAGSSVAVLTVGFGDLGPGHVQVEFTHLAELADEEFGEEFGDGPDQPGVHDMDDSDEAMHGPRETGG